MYTLKQVHLLFWLLVVALMLALAGSARFAFGQAGSREVPSSALTATIALARTNVREAGLRAYTRDDGAAINAVIVFRAEHIYRTDYLTALLRATRNAPLRHDAPRPWIVGLWPTGQRPPLWPASSQWEGRGERHWQRTLLQARDIRRGDIEHRCRVPGTAYDDVPMTPHDWGSAHDAIRFRREHPEAIELDCGQTCTLEEDDTPRLTYDGLPHCNHFFRIPRYERFDGT